jgi:hypothetical protein
MRLITIVCGLLLFALAGTAQAGSGTLAFTRPTLRVDGSVLLASEIASYNIACTYTPTGGVAAPCSGLTPPSLPGAAVGGTVTFVVAVSGQACFTLQTVDTGALVSALTLPACKAIVISPPNPPTGVTVAINFTINMAPVFKVTSLGKRSPEVAGYVDLGVPCNGNVLFTYRSKSYRNIDPAAVLWWNVVPGTSVAAPCA